MEAWQAILIGLVQGLTEFLPVSSSGHVALGALFFGVDDMPLTMVLVVHAGTLLATVIALRQDLANLVKETWNGFSHPQAFLDTEEGRTIVGVLVATVPTAVMGLTLEDRVESFSHSPTVVGGCLLITAAILITTRYAEGKRQVLSYGAFFLIGVAQGVAVLPGISRSGSTIAAAMLLGMGGTAAFRFSFLLSMPAIAGAVVLKLGNAEAWRSLGWNALVAGTVAFLSGYIALKLLRRVVVGGYFWAFSLYLIPVGAGLLLWSTLE